MKYYITTPIYYPSGDLHIGHAYTTVAGDAIARYKRMQKFDVFYLTGTDEHGQKIENSAKKAQLKPIEYLDREVANIKRLWADLNIKYDKFIRTTDSDHISAVKKIFAKMQENGDIYLGEYEGFYCISCETFWTDEQAKKLENKCLDCGKKIEKVKEKSYFLNCKKYEKKLLKHYKEHPDFIMPESRKNELIKNFLTNGVEDLAVSRNSFKWGIPVPGDEAEVIYVWIDALSNYITALGYGSEDASNLDKFWDSNGADLQLVGKEIVRFHAIYWPIILMSLNLPLPQKIFAHGWLLMHDGKMSKSKGNVIKPSPLIHRYGADSLRYYLLREIPFGKDGEFTLEKFFGRHNTDLANDLGNLISRTNAMSNQYFNGTIRHHEKYQQIELDYQEKIVKTKLEVETFLETCELSKLIESIWALISATNKYLDLTEPWKEYKNANLERTEVILYHTLELLRNILILVEPIIPESANQARIQLGLSDPYWEDIGFNKSTFKVSQSSSQLFPRLEMEVEITEMTTKMEEA